MTLLLTTTNAFEARLVAARLGSDGVLTELRGSVSGPYPGMGPVYVYVPEEEADLARALLEPDGGADAAATGEEATSREPKPWLALVAVAVLLAISFARFL